MSLFTQFKAWALRKPETGPCLGHKPPRRKYVSKVKITVTAEMREAAKLNLIFNGRRRSTRDYILRGMHNESPLFGGGAAYPGMSVPMIAAVGISVGLF